MQRLHFENIFKNEKHRNYPISHWNHELISQRFFVVEVYIQLCKKILEDIKIIPSYAAYRQNVEQIYKWRLYAAQCTKDEFAITEAIEAGVMGDLIEQAEDEAELIVFMAGTHHELNVFRYVGVEIGSRGKHQPEDQHNFS